MTNEYGNELLRACHVLLLNAYKTDFPIDIYEEVDLGNDEWCTGHDLLVEIGRYLNIDET